MNIIWSAVSGERRAVVGQFWPISTHVFHHTRFAPIVRHQVTTWDDNTHVIGEFEQLQLRVHAPVRQHGRETELYGCSAGHVGLHLLLLPRGGGHKQYVISWGAGRWVEAIGRTVYHTCSRLEANATRMSRVLVMSILESSHSSSHWKELRTASCRSFF
jgi:hypothetical protein